MSFFTSVDYLSEFRCNMIKKKKIQKYSTTTYSSDTMYTERIQAVFFPYKCLATLYFKVQFLLLTNH